MFYYSFSKLQTVYTGVFLELKAWANFNVLFHLFWGATLGAVLSA